MVSTYGTQPSTGSQGFIEWGPGAGRSATSSCQGDGGAQQGLQLDSLEQFLASRPETGAPQCFYPFEVRTQEGNRFHTKAIESSECVKGRPARSPTNICQRGATSQRPGGRHTSCRVGSQPERDATQPNLPLQKLRLTLRCSDRHLVVGRSAKNTAGTLLLEGPARSIGSSTGCGWSDGPLRFCHHCNPQTSRATAWSRPRLSAARTRTRSRRRQQFRPFVEVTEPGRISEMSIHSEKMTHPRMPP